MKILVTGKGGAASWAVRGEQLGKTIGATVNRQATKGDMDSHDLIIVVKKWTSAMEKALAATKTPIIWDIVDAYPQGKAALPFDGAKAYIESMFYRIGARAVVFATCAMSQDLDLPGFVLYHHGREGQAVNPIRDEVKSICYEGSIRYLETWIRPTVESLGLSFTVNPESIADHDIAIASRGNGFNDRVSCRWKSNIKLANCQITGTPCVLPYEAGYLETDSVAPVYYRGKAEFEDAILSLAGQKERQIAAKLLRAGAPRLKDVAAKYMRMIENAM